MRWIVTREKSDSQHLLGAVPNAVCVPAIERRDLPWPVWPPVLSERPLIYMITSAHVARRLPDDGVAVAALAPKTAHLLGPRVSLAVRGGAIALAQALVATRFHVRYPTSDLADVSSIEALLPSRFDAAIVYETARPANLETDLLAAVQPAYGLYLASPSAVTNVLACALPVPASVILLGATALARYNTLKPRGFPDATVVDDDAGALVRILAERALV